MPSIHGGLDTAELRALGLQPEQMLDFSSNINPLGISPHVEDAISQADLSAYPDLNSSALREALAGKLGIDLDRILVGNGSTELIYLVAQAQIQPGDACVIFSPTFGEYEAAAKIAGAKVHHLRSQESAAFHWSIDDAVTEIERLRPRVVFLCNPNNPTGVYLDRDDVHRVAEASGGNGLLVLDDAFASLADSPWDAMTFLSNGNVAVLRSMTKDHGLAGVRLGYLAANAELVNEARRLQPSWSVNAIAQAAGIAALEDASYVEAGREVIAEAKGYLHRELEAISVDSLPSDTNFILARVGNAADVRSALLRKRIVVRDCASFGLPEYIRIAVRTTAECAKLIDALRDVLAHE